MSAALPPPMNPAPTPGLPTEQRRARTILATHEYLPFRGGVATYVRELASAAWKQGVSLEVWTVDYQGRLDLKPTVGTHSPTESSLEPPVVRFRSNGRLTPGGLLRLAWGWWRQRRRLGADRVLLMSVGAQLVFFWFGLLRVVPARGTFCFFHGSEVLRFARGPLLRRLARRHYAQAGGFGACSEHTARVARASGLLPEGAEIAVARCALPEAFKEMAPASIDDAPAPDDGLWRVLTVARLHPRKGQLEVARALALLPATLRERGVYQTVGVGETAYRTQIEAACREGGVRCEFLGALDDRALAVVYRDCTLYAQASRTLARSVEGFGISFLEAGFYGRPAAAFLSGGVGEAVLDGETGLLVPEGDLPALAAAIERLLREPDLRARLGAAAREHARSLRWEDSARVLFQRSYPQITQISAD